MEIKQLNEQLHIILNEMSMYENPRKDFKDFRQYVLDNPKAKKSYFLFNNEYRIPHDTITHDEEGHKLTLQEWQEFLDNINYLSNGRKGNKNQDLMVNQ